MTTQQQLSTENDSAEPFLSCQKSAVLGALIAFLNVAGCQSGGAGIEPLTLEEAKSISVEFDASAYTASKGDIESFNRRLGPMRPIPNSCEDQTQILEKSAKKVAGLTVWANARFIAAIAIEEALKGNYDVAENLVRDAINMVEPRLPVRNEDDWKHVMTRGTLQVHLSRFYALSGRFDESERELSQGLNNLRRIKLPDSTRRMYQSLGLATFHHAKGEF